MKNENAATDAPRIGWFCSYTPVEIIHAAGLAPVRIIGHSSPIKKADSYMHPNMCPYVRSCLDLGLEGACGNLAGTVFVNSCDAMRRLHDIWRNYVPGAGFSLLIDLPRGRGDSETGYFKDEIKRLKSELEQRLSLSITNTAISNSIKTYNTARALYREISALRKQDPPRIAAAELMKNAQDFFSTRPEEWSVSVWQLLTRLQPRPAASGRPRVILTGSPIHDPQIIAFFEDCGLDLVFDDLCSGSRYFSLEISETGGPLAALARAYISRPPCARMIRAENRAAWLISLAAEYNAHGVIHCSLKFCDTTLYDVPPLKNALTAAGIKTLFIESDGTLGSFGQLKTRIQAFTEILAPA